jgi:acetate kinase
MKVLVLNSGSSSQKSALYDVRSPIPAEPPAPVWHAEIEWAGDWSILRVATLGGESLDQQIPITDRRAAIAQMLTTLWSTPAGVAKNNHAIDVVGHRVVHGAHKFEDAVVVTEEVKSAIASVAAFAPLHNRAELEGIEVVERMLGKVPQVAVFDTAFHRTLPLAAAVYPGPYEWFEHGIQRYGFHGINYQFCADRVAHLLEQDLRSLKIVCCHLGNGCSLAAIDGGRSVDTTMGFTPLDGLMMGTRSGSVDPGILTYLMRQQRLSGEGLDSLLNKKSGLLGISGISADMRDILAGMRQGNDRAKLAFDMFVHRLATGIASVTVALGRMDVLIFTGGIGEHSPEVRAAACDKLSFLGVELDSEKNVQCGSDCRISSTRSRILVFVIRAQEDWQIAKTCVRKMEASAAVHS